MTAAVALDLGDARDVVDYAGLIRGTPLLGGGQDEYDGRFRRQTGAVGGEDGNDALWGGVGNDVFVFLRDQGTDQITDFHNGADRLDLRAVDIDSFTELKALSSPASLGIRIDLTGDGMLFVGGLTFAQFNATDVLL